MSNEEDDVVRDIQSLRDAGLKWKDVGECLNLSPSSLYRLRKKVRFDEMPENRTIGEIITCVMDNLSSL